MSRSKLPEEIVRFVRDHIHSVEQLEILLLMRSQPGRTWTAEMVRDEIRSGLASVVSRLDGLVEGGLVVNEGGPPAQFRYSPKSETLARAVDLTADAYHERRFTVIDLIFSRPTDVLRGFASAFKFRKDEDDG